MRDALVTRGCAHVETHEVSAAYSQPSVAALMKTLMPFFRFVPGVKALNDREWARLRAALVEAFNAYAGSDGIVHLPVEAMIGIGQKR